MRRFLMPNISGEIATTNGSIGIPLPPSWHLLTKPDQRFQVVSFPEEAFGVLSAKKPGREDPARFFSVSIRRNQPKRKW